LSCIVVGGVFRIPLLCLCCSRPHCCAWLCCARKCSVCIVVDGDPTSLSLSLSLCCSHNCQDSAISVRRHIMLPYSKIHRRATLFACGSKRAAESCCCLGGLGLRRGPLTLGLLNAQRYQTYDSRQCSHLHLKVVGRASFKPPLSRRLCLRRRPLALGQAPCARGLADSYRCIAHLQDF
jgi:hypothetical protein